MGHDAAPETAKLQNLTAFDAWIKATGANIGHRKKFAIMLECADKLTDSRWVLIDKGKFNCIWDTLSAEYVKYSRGEVEIWSGQLANTLIRTELKALIERADLPKDTLIAASRIAVRYAKHHEDQKVFSEKVIAKAMADLRAGRKH